METWIVLAEEFASNFLDIQGPIGSGDELRQLAQRAYEEVKQGSSISQVLQVVVGRKPEAEHSSKRGTAALCSPSSILKAIAVVMQCKGESGLPIFWGLDLSRRSLISIRGSFRQRWRISLPHSVFTAAKVLVNLCPS